MKALSLIEPWASLVAHGFKKVETRSWSAKWRGYIAIHASKNQEVVRNPWEVSRLFLDAGIDLPAYWPKKPSNYPLGMVVAVARLDRCALMTKEMIQAQTKQERAFGAWEVGRYAWFFGRVIPLKKPTPCRGALGLWDLKQKVETMVSADAYKESEKTLDA